MATMSLLEPIEVPGRIVETYMREVRAGRWQNAAKISGMSELDLRALHDPNFAGVQTSGSIRAALELVEPVKKPDLKRFTLPKGWTASLRPRMTYLGLSAFHIAKAVGMPTVDLEERLFRGGVVTRDLFTKVESFLWPEGRRVMS